MFCLCVSEIIFRRLDDGSTSGAATGSGRYTHPDIWKAADASATDLSQEPIGPVCEAVRGIDPTRRDLICPSNVAVEDRLLMLRDRAPIGDVRVQLNLGVVPLDRDDAERHGTQWDVLGSPLGRAVERWLIFLACGAEEGAVGGVMLARPASPLTRGADAAAPISWPRVMPDCHARRVAQEQG
jgi:hypothetical protein